MPTDRGLLAEAKRIVAKYDKRKYKHDLNETQFGTMLVDAMLLQMYAATVFEYGVRGLRPYEVVERSRRGDLNMGPWNLVGICCELRLFESELDGRVELVMDNKRKRVFASCASVEGMRRVPAQFVIDLIERHSLVIAAHVDECVSAAHMQTVTRTSLSDGVVACRDRDGRVVGYEGVQVRK